MAWPERNKGGKGRPADEHRAHQGGDAVGAVARILEDLETTRTGHAAGDGVGEVRQPVLVKGAGHQHPHDDRDRRRDARRRDLGHTGGNAADHETDQGADHRKPRHRANHRRRRSTSESGCASETERPPTTPWWRSALVVVPHVVEHVRHVGPRFGRRKVLERPTRWTGAFENHSPKVGTSVRPAQAIAIERDGRHRAEALAEPHVEIEQRALTQPFEQAAMTRLGRAVADACSGRARSGRPSPAAAPTP